MKNNFKSGYLPNSMKAYINNFFQYFADRKYINDVVRGKKAITTEFEAMQILIELQADITDLTICFKNSKYRKCLILMKNITRNKYADIYIKKVGFLENSLIGIKRNCSI